MGEIKALEIIDKVDLENYLKMTSIGPIVLARNSYDVRHVLREYISSTHLEHEIEWQKVSSIIRIAYPNLVDRMEDPDEKYSRSHTSETPWPCLPLYNRDFLYGLSMCLRMWNKSNPGSETVKFLDAGCGVGAKMILAMLMSEPRSGSLEVAGIEYNDFIYKFARNQVNEFLSERYPIYCEDITTFEGYGDHNIIYAYNPINGVKGMYKFFKKVLETAKTGTICFFHNVDTGNDAMYQIAREKNNRFFEKSNHYGIYVVKEK